MRYLLLTAALAMNMQAMVAQSSYQVKNSVTLRNEDCDLTKMSVILPVAVSNIYQDVVGLKESSGMVLDLDASKLIDQHILVNIFASHYHMLKDKADK